MNQGAATGQSLQQMQESLARLLREGSSNLSVAQQRYWFLNQMTPDSPNHLFATYELNGVLNEAALKQALSEVVGRHESLRASFIELEGRPLRVVLPNTSLTLFVTDVSEHPAQDEEIRRLAAREMQQPFDLGKGPSVRGALVRLAPDRHLLLITVHRIVADEWSMDLLIREVAELYEAFESRRDPQLPEVGVSFAAFAHQQQEWLKGEEAEAELRFWRRQLAGLEPVAFPTDRPRPAVQTFRGAVRTHRLPSDLAAAVRDFDRREGVTPFMTLLAGFQAMVFRYAGQEDFAVGSPAASRPGPELEGLVGPVTNTLVLRANLAGNPSFRDLVRRVRTGCLEAQEHQATPFEKLVEQLHPERDLSRSPFFQLMFTMSDTPRQYRAGGLCIAPLPLDTGTAAFDLTITVMQPDSGMELAAEYNTDLFDAATIDRLLVHFTQILTAAVADPRLRLSELPMLTEAERRMLLEEWAHGPVEPIPDLCAHNFIERQAELTPEATAIIAGGERVSFRQLNEQANQLAYYLRSRGVGPDVLVAVFCERSPRLVIALLAIWKAGGAYVPLDPAYPEERLAFMLQDSHVPVILTQEALLARLPRYDGAVVCLDRDWSELVSGQPVENLTGGAGSSDLAYIIYTSGSTGQPKGAMIHHRGLVNYLTWSVKAYEMAEGQGAPVHSSIAFDLTVTGLFVPLAGGRPATLVPDEGRVVGALCTALRNGGFSLVKVTPSHLEMIAQFLPPAAAERATRRLVVGGEALYGDTVRYWADHAPDTLIVNEYGPTETVVGCCVFEQRASQVGRGPVPIGRPIANTSLYVLDKYLQPVPPGVPGELCIGGAGVASGYLNRPELTAERFVPDPFSDCREARMYRTGDLVRYRPDGNLEYLGRVDQQVKVRGYRIELGEIESVLQLQPAVRAAAVTVREDSPGDKRLVAYVVPKENAGLSRDELIAFVQTRLPEYMVPSAWVVLDALPLTPNGKVDRKALPAPDTGRPDPKNDYVAPLTALEKDVASIVRELLRVDRVGVNDNLFDLGAHSLLLAQFSRRLQTVYGIDLPVQHFFDVPTVAGLARVIEIYQTAGRDAALGMTGVVDLEAEVVLDPAITPEGLPMADSENPAHIFLTGVTGYLGIFLLAELLHQTDATVHCLLRGASPEQAFARIENTLRHYRIWEEGFRPRIVPVIGDLSQPLLGLSAETFQELAATIDVIYHSGAMVNFVFPYSALKATNVEGTKQVLKLACTTRAKPVHYISALDVFLSRFYHDRKIREDEPSRPGGQPSGYVQSKWVGEKLVHLAKTRGLPAVIYRPWIVMGHTETGACHSTDYLSVALKGCLQLGMFPIHEAYIEVMPIDWVSRSMIHISRQKESQGKVFHFFNPNGAHVLQVYEWIKSYGYKADVVDWNAWRDLALKVDDSNALSTVTPIIHEEGTNPERINLRIDCTNTLEALEGTGLVCPPVTEELTHRVLSFLVDTGFLPPPSGPAARSGASAAALEGVS
jgi:amino acid adenylation domain-containing protein/thioester reductase-like protein